jgi:hypothetical protein
VVMNHASPLHCSLQLLSSSSNVLSEKGWPRQWRQPALGRPPEPSAVWDTRLAAVELLCSRLLGLDLSAVGRDWASLGMQQPRSGIMQSLRDFLLFTWRTLSACYNARPTANLHALMEL